MMRVVLSMIFSFMMFFTLNCKELSYNKIQPHPRLLMKRGEEKKIIKQLDNGKNAYLCNANDLIFSFAESLFDQPFVSRPASGHILAQSREVEKRVFYLAYAYRITGDVRYAKRAEEEMLNACSWSDWDPDHWLDTAEVMTALAIGYDWLFDYLSQESKDIITDALINKGLRTAEGQKWYDVDYNWNQVCNSAMVGTSLAVYELIPEEAKQYIAKSVASNPKAMAVYAPDGAYPEGYGYWNYGTTYQVLMIEFVRTALGQELGIEKSPGFLKSAEFIQMMETPSGKAYAFYDSQVEQLMMPMVFWFARECRDLSLCWSACAMLEKEKTKTYTNKEVDRFLPCAVIYASQLNLNSESKPTRTAYYAKGKTPLYLYRSGWEGQTDTYLGVKGGAPTNNHAHMDNGSFIFEKNGIQWATDLGMQGYGSFYKHNISIWDFTQNSQRWGCYRMSNKSHNTLIIDDANHNVDGRAEILEVFNSKGEKGCKVDMGPTLAPYVSNATRIIKLNQDNTELTINDVLDIIPGESHILKWNMITRASARIESDKSIILSKKGYKMRLEVVSPQKVTVMVDSAQSDNVYDNPNYGASCVGFILKLPAGGTYDMTVKLTTIE